MLYREEPRDPMATYIGRPTRVAAPPPPPPKQEVEVYRKVTHTVDLITIVKLRAVDVNTGEVVRSAEYETANYAGHRLFAIEKWGEFNDELLKEGYKIRRHG